MGDDHSQPRWLGSLKVGVVDPRNETGRDSADDHVPSFVSYGIVAETTLPHFSRSYMATRKRFRDFAFLHDALVRDFPACVVPPLPDKHHLESFAGDRFADEFVSRRCGECVCTDQVPAVHGAHLPPSHAPARAHFAVVPRVE